MKARLLMALLAALSACTDFAHPSELDHAQIIGLRAEPPSIAPGERSRLQLLVAGPGGPIAPVVVWRATGGRIELDGEETYAVADGAESLLVEAAVDVDGRQLVARKWVSIAKAAGTNPEMTQLRVGALVVGPEDVVSVTASATVPLSFEVSPALDERALISWYTTAGDIDRYRIAGPELLVSPDVGAGWLIVVIRNGSGGVCWRAVRIDIVP